MTIVACAHERSSASPADHGPGRRLLIADPFEALAACKCPL